MKIFADLTSLLKLAGMFLLAGLILGAALGIYA